MSGGCCRGVDLDTPGPRRLEYLAHWTGLGGLVERALDETHDGEGRKRVGSRVKLGRRLGQHADG